ncbi:uncharacterized protein LOC106655019 [Trichogramma pretiosum]|uniref:uncharacterized protein LOC106655019 n=1 Tax=Trichogramma pretiosum TaxID=7493 RepID=UPI0006C96763|nr:uncharacterized protein LOC106655019 [Trichogramma pretiosum]
MSGSSECFVANIVEVSKSLSNRPSRYTKLLPTKTLKLKQNPEEDIKLTLKFYDNCFIESEDGTMSDSDSDPSYTSILNELNLDLIATFDNYVHEVYADSTQKYEYKIELRALVKKNDGDEIHVNFPRILHEIRTDKVIQFPTQELPRNCRKLRHVCFSISRLISNDNITVNDLFPILRNSYNWSFKNTSCISLVVGSEKFPVHKEILSSKSDVFAAMFKHEVQENDTKIVKIEDFEADVIDEMIRFMYTDEIKIPIEHPQDLYAVADKYQIEDLKAKCLEFLIFNLNFSNSTSLYKFAKLYDIDGLMKTLNSFFKKYEQHMVQEETYRNYLCESINLGNFVDVLFLCTKFKDDLEEVKKVAYNFFVNNTSQIFEIPSFQDWFYKYKSECYDLCKFLVNSKTSSLSISQN